MLRKDPEDDNVIDLQEARLKLAPKEPPKGGNWLSSLPKGTRFLAIKKNSPEPICGDFVVGTDPTQMTAVYIGFEVHTQGGGWKFVEPVRFSQMFEFIQTIGAEIYDDGSEIQDGRVEGDAGP